MIDYGLTTGGPTILPLSRASVLFDGVFTTPRLQHPECVAIGPDGWIWSGGENGQILRIAPDGSAIEEVAATGGFTLGLAFDGDRALFTCDLTQACVFRLDLGNRSLRRFTAPGILIPNYPLIDRARNRLLVSDSHSFSRPGPGIWSYDLETGEGRLWFDRPLVFANGIAMANGGEAVFVCETFARRVTRVTVERDGSAGAATIYGRSARPAGRYRL
jgi:gluconolactonase